MAEPDRALLKTDNLRLCSMYTGRQNEMTQSDWHGQICTQKIEVGTSKNYSAIEMGPGGHRGK